MTNDGVVEVSGEAWNSTKGVALYQYFVGNSRFIHSEGEGVAILHHVSTLIFCGLILLVAS